MLRLFDTGFFIDRPIFAAVLSIVVTLLGLFALQRLPVNRYPLITPPAVSVKLLTVTVCPLAMDSPARKLTAEADPGATVEVLCTTSAVNSEQTSTDATGAFAAVPASDLCQSAQPVGVPVPPMDVQQNTSPQLPPVPQDPASPMQGIETSRTTDNFQ